MRPKPFLVVVLIGMLLVSACQGISTPAAYPNATDIKSEKEAILQQAYAVVDEYNALIETEKQTGNFGAAGDVYFLFRGESLKRVQQKETEVLNKIAELNEAYYQLTLQEISMGAAYPNQQEAADREFKLAMGDFSGPSKEEWENGTYVSIYSTQSGVYSKVAIGDLYLIVRENNILSATAQAKYEEHLNTIPVPENIVQAIQRIEGKGSHVKVGGSSGFSDPSLKRVILTTYQTETRAYAFYDRTDQLISINPKEMPAGIQSLSVEELEKLAWELVSLASPGINMDTLTPDHRQKIGTYFFQWIDNSKTLSNGHHPKIQVGLNGKGELLSYYNTIPLAINPTDTVTPDEIDVHAIQRVEGMRSQVKVGGDSGFTLTPLFSSDSFLSRYETDSRYYAFDGLTHRIIAIHPKTMPAGIVDLPVPELEKIVRDLIALAAPDLNLDALTPDHSSKTGTYLFHWDDPTKQFEDGTYYYIQVEMNGKGELLSYVNLIPLAR